MAKNQIIELSTTAALNTDVVGVNIDEGMFPDGVNNAMRNIGKILADAVARHVTKTVGSYTPVKTDHNQFWRCTGAVTLNLTAAATLSDGWCLWVRANGGAVTIDPSGAETIDGAATLTVPDGMMALIVCTGTTFFVAAGYGNSTVTANVAFAGVSNVTLATSGAGTIFLRPNGAASGTAQGTMDSAGLLTTPAMAITTGAIISGTWTAVTALGANVAAVAPNADGFYTRVGNVVTCSLQVNCDPTSSAVLTDFFVTLPVASNIGAATDLTGSGGSDRDEVAYILGIAASDRASVRYMPKTTSASNIYMTFQYKVI